MSFHYVYILIDEQTNPLSPLLSSPIRVYSWF